MIPRNNDPGAGAAPASRQAARLHLNAGGLALAAAGLVAVALCWRPAPVSAQQGCEGNLYAAKVQPILAANCYRCHGGMNHRGGLQLDSKEGILRGGKDGAVIIPGHPEQSLLVKLIRHESAPDDLGPMPPKGKLSDADIATVARWIECGAQMP